MPHQVFCMGELPKFDDGRRSKHVAKVFDGRESSR